MPEATVHIVDDDPTLRTALIRLCRSAGLSALGHRDASDLALCDARTAPHCILLDVRLADANGLAVQEALRAAGSTVPIIFLTGYGTIPMTVRALRGGAVEFLTKPVLADVLLAAVTRALEADEAALSARTDRRALSDRLDSLTKREQDVMLCAIGGLMNKQIAGELGITEITAKVHKRRVMEKMQVRSLADLVRAADRLGLAATRQR